MPTTVTLRIAPQPVDRAQIVRHSLGMILAVGAALTIVAITYDPRPAAGSITITAPETAACILARAALPCALLSP